MTQGTEHPVTPALQYLRLLWASRWIFLGIVGLCVVLAAAMTMILPKRFRSEVVLSVQPTPSLQPTAMFYRGVLAAGQDAPLRTITPQSLVRRLRANRTVTLAARDVGLIGPDAFLDERQIGRWVDVEDVAETELVVLAVQQPTAMEAQRFASRILARALDANREEVQAGLSQVRAVLVRELQKASDAVRAREQEQLQAARETVAGPEREIRLERTGSELRLAREAYEGVHKRLSALELVWAEQVPALRVVDPPSTPVRPAFPRPVLFISIGLILGVLFATLFVVLRAALAAPEPAGIAQRDVVPAALATSTTLPR